MFDLIPFEHGSRHMSSYNPFRDFEDFEKEFFGRNAFAAFRTDIKDNGKEYELEADLPGFNKDDIHVDIEGNYLTVNAERKSEKDEKDEKGNYIRRERSYGSFSRSFNVSNVKTEDIKVSYKDGVLKLIMPKKENSLPSSRHLEIE
ncbi:MAG: Hsp20/alpha crystallin family protein [Eubacteriales bacterium]